MKRLMIALFLGLGVAGCDQSKDAAPAADSPKTPAADTTAAAPAAPVRKEKCLLCKDHEIEVTAETPRATHDGKEYFFCSDYCKEDFVKDPAAAIAKHAK